MILTKLISILTISLSFRNKIKIDGIENFMGSKQAIAPNIVKGIKGNSFEFSHDYDHLSVNNSLIPRMIRRTKTKYFNNGKLLWEDNTSAGKYVRENCKVIKVIRLAKSRLRI